MRKVILWGAGVGYDRILNQLKFEIMKENIQIQAVIVRPEDFVGSSIDGFKVIKKEEIWDYEFDYLIVTSTKWYREICKEAALLGVEEKAIINGMIFLFPLFDFARYAGLIENPITILSNNCWGGAVYHRLYLKFCSPLINIFTPMDSYIKLISDVEYYFSQPLTCIRDADIRRNWCPIGALGTGDRQIQLQFLHELSFAEAKEQWNRRLERVNYNHIFVAMLFDDIEKKRKEYLKTFGDIKYDKICFYSGETDIESVVYLKRFEWFLHQGDNARTYSYKTAVFTYMEELMFKSIDMLKLLNGEKEYMRE